ncbi:putative polysaccharide biosynthesis protein [Liquorilactobacillus cacaonum]|nr:polysaccharide biosynthesis protein [Liquorilactobacillus cacaonum]
MVKKVLSESTFPEVGKEEIISKKNEIAKAKMLRGSAWMTMGSIFSRILGALYIIPWYTWFGRENLAANNLYTQGYTVYSVFLMISIAGIPSAVSKQISNYNGQNEYALGQRLYKKLILIMLGLGIVSAIIMWFIAPFLSQNDKNVIPVYRSLAIALTIIPTMSLTRGFFQGYQDMFPSAMSQLIEQIARIIYMLGTTFIIMKILKGSYVSGVVQSTFAAFIGAIAGLSFLAWFYFRKKDEFALLAKQSANELIISDSQIIKNLLFEAIPFVVISVSTTVYNLIDQFTFKQIMLHFTNYGVTAINDLYTIFAGNSNKLIMIIISLASAMSATAIPLLAQAYSNHNKEQTALQLADAIELFFFIMLPCSLGMAAVAKPLYVVFYQYNFTGVYVLSFSAYVALPIGLFMVLASLLQGVYQNMKAIKFFLIGLAIKIILQFPLTLIFHPFGPLMATGIGMTVSSCLMLRYFYYNLEVNMGKIIKRFDQLLIFSLVVFAVSLGLIQLSDMFLNLEYRITALIVLFIAVGAGGLTYIYLVLKTKVADKIIGSRAAILRKKLRIR